VLKARIDSVHGIRVDDSSDDIWDSCPLRPYEKGAVSGPVADPTVAESIGVEVAEEGFDACIWNARDVAEHSVWVASSVGSGELQYQA
jgi:hypothetical protein